MKKFVIVIAAMLAVSVFFLQSGTAGTENVTTASATATIKETISVTLSYVPADTGIKFTNLDPGAVNISADDHLNISIDYGTNVKTNITQKGDATFVNGPDNFPIDNLRYSNLTQVTDSTQMSSSNGLPVFLDWENIPKPTGGDNQYRDTYYWLSVPAAQTAGTYTTNIYVNVSKY